MTGTTVILASGSARRQELLQGLGLEFVVFPSSASEIIEEKVEPKDYVRILAERKARDVAQHYAQQEKGNYLVIGADTIVVLDDRLGKPSGPEDAKQMLTQLQGRNHFVFTGVCVIEVHTGKERTEVCQTRVTMEKLDPDRIQRYIATGKPWIKLELMPYRGKEPCLYLV